MPNGDPFWHVTQAITDLRGDMRDLRGEIGGLRTDLTDTRETVARMQGVEQGEQRVQVNVVEHRRSFRTWATDTAGVLAIIISSGAAVVALLH